MTKKRNKLTDRLLLRKNHFEPKTTHHKLTTYDQ